MGVREKAGDGTVSSIMMAANLKGDRNHVWSRMWAQAGMIGVRREFPSATPTGKILQFHLRPCRR